MSELLKGNFRVKQQISEAYDSGAETMAPNRAIAEKLRKAALASIGGSMVYMERTELTWNGDDK